LAKPSVKPIPFDAMRLTISHTTSYSYDSPVTRLAQVIRLCPLSTPGQQVLHWHVRGNDGKPLQGVRDGFGNVCHFHSVTSATRHVSIAVEGVVETHDTGGVSTGAHEPLPSLFYLAPTEYTRSDADIAALAEAVRRPDAVETLHTLMQVVRDRIDYVVDSTAVTNTAREALTQGRGVCQDHAHVMISAARLLGFPARYVSGYLWSPEHSEDVASHAWMEALVEGLGWTGFDAANRQSPTDAYVRLAVGRDYADAAPVRGVRVGGQTETLAVKVQVQNAGQQ
jgi:transglutaminase-like putative cysteine protease